MFRLTIYKKEVKITVKKAGGVMCKKNWSIMFVCHGNICRSPMAECIFKHLINQKRVEHLFTVNSSATSREEIWGDVGNPIYPPAVRELERNKIPVVNHRAVQLAKSDYEKYDYIIAMDSNNLYNIKRIVGVDSENKVKKLMNFAGSDKDVADPWYTDSFDIAFNDIYLGCTALLEFLLQKA